jgi:hypothetical protein
MYKRNILIMGIASAFLSGCGGSTAIVPTVETIADATYGQQYEFDAISQISSYTRNAPDWENDWDDNVTSLTSYQSSTTSTELTIGTESNGAINYVRIEDNHTGVDVEISGANEFQRIPGGGLTLALDNDNPAGDEVDLIIVSPANFEYQKFGGWQAENISGNSGDAGVFSVGMSTPVSGIPTSGTATYSGEAFGWLIDDSGENDNLHALFNATANFSNRTLAMSTTNSAVDFGEQPAPQHNITGTLSYASDSGVFSGDVSNNSGHNGSATGKFYGPNAEEIGGVISIQGNTAISATTLGFGAQK